LGGLCLLLLWLVVAPRAIGQSVEVPLDVQVSLFLKATTFDRAFSPKLQKNGVIEVGIAYQEKNRPSVKEMEELKAAFAKPVAGFKIHVTPIPIDDGVDVAGRKEWGALSALYVTSMRGIELAAFLNESRKHQVLSVCTDPALVGKGVSMGFELVGSRPHFVINRDNAIAEGCDFSSQLLKLARIY
jgi:hypothetical protein